MDGKRWHFQQLSMEGRLGMLSGGKALKYSRNDESFRTCQVLATLGREQLAGFLQTPGDKKLSIKFCKGWFLPT